MVTISPDGKITDAQQATAPGDWPGNAGTVGTDFSDTSPTRTGPAGYRQVLAEGVAKDTPHHPRSQGEPTDVLDKPRSTETRGRSGGCVRAARDITGGQGVGGAANIASVLLGPLGWESPARGGPALGTPLPLATKGLGGEVISRCVPGQGNRFVVLKETSPARGGSGPGIATLV